MGAQDHASLIRAFEVAFEVLARRPRDEALAVLQGLGNAIGETLGEMKSKQQRRKKGPGRPNLLVAISEKTGCRLTDLTGPGWLVAMEEERLFTRMEHLLKLAKAKRPKKKLITIALEVMGEKTINGRRNFYFVDISLPQKTRERIAKSLVYKFTQRKKFRKQHKATFDKLERELRAKWPRYELGQLSEEDFVEAGRHIMQEVEQRFFAGDSTEAIYTRYPDRFMALAFENELSRFDARCANTGMEVREVGSNRLLATGVDLAKAGLVEPGDATWLASPAKSRAIIESWLRQADRTRCDGCNSAPNR